MAAGEDFPSPNTQPWFAPDAPPQRPIRARIHNEALEGERTLPTLLDDNDSVPADTTNDDDKNRHRYLKTGTTIVGIRGDGFCILGADTRATAGRLVADQTALKLHVLSDHCVAAGAGTSADLEHLCREACYTGKLEALHHPNNSNVSVHWMLQFLQRRLYEQQGTCQANLIVAGMDETGNGLLRALHPHGSMDVVDYTALGSGGYAAMGILEDEYRPDMTLEEAMDVVIRSVQAGVRHDLGSGSQVDVCVLLPGQAANVTRAVAYEPQLQTHTATLPTDGGVNGFTSHPAFVVKSKRILHESREKQLARKLEEWKDVLK